MPNTVSAMLTIIIVIASRPSYLFFPQSLLPKSRIMYHFPRFPLGKSSVGLFTRHPTNFVYILDIYQAQYKAWAMMKAVDFLEYSANILIFW